MTHAFLTSTGAMPRRPTPVNSVLDAESVSCAACTAGPSLSERIRLDAHEGQTHISLIIVKHKHNGQQRVAMAGRGHGRTGTRRCWDARLR